MSEVLSAPLALDAPAVEALIASSPAQPAWLAALRRGAIAAASALPDPRRTDEPWRFSAAGGLSTAGWRLAEPAGPIDVADLIARANVLPHAAGRAVFVDDELVAWTPIDPALAARGVVFAPWAEALASHGDRLRELLAAERPIGLGSAKFEALNLAFFRAGMVLLVPKGVEVEHPFIVTHVGRAAGATTFPRQLFVGGAHAKAELVERHLSATDDLVHQVCGISSVHAGEGSRLRHVLVQDEGHAAVSLHLQGSVAAKDADLRTFSFQLGAARSRHENHAHLDGPGANLEMSGLSVAFGTQELDSRTFQSHHAPHARSDLLFKSVLCDEARTIFAGLIRVDENAQRTDAYQSNRNLLLDPRAEANSLPGLEILANDVRCTHGSTTAQLSDEELFYLRSRGLPRRSAQRLLTIGFLEAILARIDDEELSALLHEAFETRFPA